MICKYQFYAEVGVEASLCVLQPLTYRTFVYPHNYPHSEVCEPDTKILLHLDLTSLIYPLRLHDWTSHFLQQISRQCHSTENNTVGTAL